MSLAANWGATADERALPMECDSLLSGEPLAMHRAVSVCAPSSTVFRWLCQLKLAPYSYDLLDNLGRRSPRDLRDGVECLEVGQRFMWIFSLVSFSYGEHITLRSRNVAVTYMVLPDEENTRLLARVLFRAPGGRVRSALIGRVLAVGDLVMMRKQLLTLKALSERDDALALIHRCDVRALAWAVIASARGPLLSGWAAERSVGWL